MKRIPLTGGKFALVDDEDFEILSKWKWQYCRDGYARHSTHAEGGAIRIVMHRFLMQTRPDEIVDHKDNNKLNNQRSNLRITTKSRNNQNNRSIRSKSGFKGVVAKDGFFTAELSHEGKKLYLGAFRTEFEAARAYDKRAVELYGEHAATNLKIYEEIVRQLKEGGHEGVKGTCPPG